MKRLSFLIACLAIISLAVSAQTIYQVKQTPPVKLGTSGGNVLDATSRYCCSGTLGALVSKAGVPYILSNNHVLARVDQAVVGEDISQPGLVDTSCSYTNSNIVADYSVAAKLGTLNVDAALAQARSGMVASTGEILTIGIPSNTLAVPTVGRGVAKAGRTTGFTCGSIGSISTDVSVQYQKSCGSNKKFTVSYVDQVVINSSTFSAGGDSGSLIVTSDTAQPVALLFAGSTTTTIGNPIQDVTNALGITFVGGSTHSISCPVTLGAVVPTTTYGISQSEYERARLAKQHHVRSLFGDPAVQGVGIGEDPDNPGLAVLVIYVEQGRAHGPIPAELEGVKTVKIITDRFRAYGWNEKQTGMCTKQ